jgi:hypothetical protein
MKTLLLTLLWVTNASLLAEDTRIEEIGTSPVEAVFPSGGEIHMDLCSSGVELRGTDENRVRVSFSSERSTGNVRVRIVTASRRADINVTSCPHNNFEMTIEVPKSSSLYTRMFAGQMEISSIIGSKDVEMHAGELTIGIGEPTDYAQVDASVTTGEVDAAPFNVSKGGLFRSFHRSGPGKYRLHAHVGAGQLDLR